MAHTLYQNFVLANEIEDQYNSHLDLMRFCTIANQGVVDGAKTHQVQVAVVLIFNLRGQNKILI